MVIGTQLPVPIRILNRTLGSIGIAGYDGGAHTVQRNAIGGQPVGVQLNANRRQCPAADGYLSYAIDLRQALRDGLIGEVRELRATIMTGASAGLTLR